MTELTHEELTRLLDYDPETGVFRWRVDVAKNTKAGRVAGCRAYDGNVISINGTARKSRRLAWFYVYGEMPRNNLFVKNRDQFDDRISNLGMLPDKPKELTHEYLKQCIDYNPVTGEFKWKITQSNNIYGNDAFYVKIEDDNKITLRTAILCRGYMTSRLIVFWMTGYMPSPKRVVFPIDNNVLNLKWSNIKVGDYSEMQIKKRNIGILASKGVNFDARYNKYRARIAKNGNSIFLGYFKTEAEAHAAYMKAARKHFGELANDGYQHAMYEMEYEAVEQETEIEGDTYPQVTKALGSHVSPDEKPAVVHDVYF